METSPTTITYNPIFNTNLETTAKILIGNKWQKRFLVLQKYPSSNSGALFVYKKAKSVQNVRAKKEILTIDGYFGLEAGFDFDDERYTLAIVCQSRVIVLAFPRQSMLTDWEWSIRKSFGFGYQYSLFTLETPPSLATICQSYVRLHLFDGRFCLVTDTPARMLADFRFAEVRRFGSFENKFCIEVGQRAGSWSGVYVFRTGHCQQMSVTFRLASMERLNEYLVAPPDEHDDSNLTAANESSSSTSIIDSAAVASKSTTKSSDRNGRRSTTAAIEVQNPNRPLRNNRQRDVRNSKPPTNLIDISEEYYPDMENDKDRRLVSSKSSSKRTNQPGESIVPSFDDDRPSQFVEISGWINNDDESFHEDISKYPKLDAPTSSKADHQENLIRFSIGDDDQQHRSIPDCGSHQYLVPDKKIDRFSTAIQQHQIDRKPSDIVIYSIPSPRSDSTGNQHHHLLDRPLIPFDDDERPLISPASIFGKAETSILYAEIDTIATRAVREISNNRKEQQGKNVRRRSSTDSDESSLTRHASTEYLFRGKIKQGKNKLIALQNIFRF